jgi:SAM-dependent methyltransferase
MTSDESIVGLGSWLQTPPGRCLLQWEQARLDQTVADAFGFHALQLGLPGLQGLRANRMPHRWVAATLDDGDDDALALAATLPAPDPGISTQPPEEPLALRCDFDALPFPSHSIDLVVMPHTLELSRDPHLTLREVERVLVGEGRVVITGFNPASLWALRQRLGQMRPGFGLARTRPAFLPRSGEFIGYWRLRDWLRLLGFEIEAGRFGVYRPPFASQALLDRFGWLDRVGDRWWPVLGAAYSLVAVKRVRGMRLVGLVRREHRRAKATAAAVNREAEPALQRVDEP